MEHISLKKTVLTSCLGLVSLTHSLKVNAQEKYNVLFIMIDDLRPELGCFGRDYIKSPNIDRLASEGIAMHNAYCNISVSGSSRASLLTGLYPTRNRFTTYYASAIKEVPEIVSLPEHFKNNGYETLSVGKIFHNYETDMLRAWSETPWHPATCDGKKFWRDYRAPENMHAMKNNKGGAAWEDTITDDDEYFDGKTAAMAVKRLKQYAENGKQFFLGVGFLKPHLPFNAPRKYWDMYTKEEVSLAPNPFYPKDAPKEATRYNYDEIRDYDGIPRGREKFSDELALKLRHGYFASVSYVDAQVGRVMDALRETGLDKNTIVVLFGDHGWSLGEHSHWCKHTCFHTNLNTPLIFSVPGYQRGVASEATISYVDLYPTLCELTGLDKPKHLQGESAVKLLKDPTIKGGYEFCRYPDGEAVVTDRYVYTEYFDKKTQSTVSRMLYDHATDPQENVNVAEHEEYKAVVKKLSKLLHKHVKRVNK